MKVLSLVDRTTGRARSVVVDELTIATVTPSDTPTATVTPMPGVCEVQPISGCARTLRPNGGNLTMRDRALEQRGGSGLSVNDASGMGDPGTSLAGV